MGVLPGQKFVWLKAKSDSNVPEGIIRFNQRYLQILGVSAGSKVVVVYEGSILFTAVIEVATDLQRGIVLINERKMSEFGLNDGTAVMIATPRK